MSTLDPQDPIYRSHVDSLRSQAAFIVALKARVDDAERELGVLATQAVKQGVPADVVAQASGVEAPAPEKPAKAQSRSKATKS